MRRVAETAHVSEWVQDIEFARSGRTAFSNIEGDVRSALYACQSLSTLCINISSMNPRVAGCYVAVLQNAARFSGWLAWGIGDIVRNVKCIWISAAVYVEKCILPRAANCSRACRGIAQYTGEECKIRFN